MDIVKKSYKPEILVCPKCNTKLKYVYCISKRTITFTQGKRIEIKNLAYKCPCCNQVYTSQTANKLAIKGLRYSTKVCMMIYYYKSLGYTRDAVCDYLNMNDIFISDRNVDFIYQKFITLLNKDYSSIIKEQYNDMLNKYQDIKLSIDLVTYNKRRLIVIRNFYNNEIIGFYYYEEFDSDKIRDMLSLYLSKDLPITHIFTTRKNDYFYPIIKNLVPNKAKFISYYKI